MSAGESKKEFRTLDAIGRLFWIVDQKHPTHLTATAKVKDEFYEAEFGDTPPEVCR
jgi:hypothetical protein